MSPPDTAAPDDRFAVPSRLMPLDEALGLLRGRVRAVAATEEVRLPEAAGRVLAEDVVSPIAIPGYDNSAMDGYVVRHGDLAPEGPTRLPVVARIAAGHVMTTPLPVGAAAQIFTGAPIPEGGDSVVMQEDVTRDGDAVVIPPGVRRNDNVRYAGEDVAEGAVVLRAGRRLRAQEVAMAAAVGRASLAVRRPVTVAVFSTGDELRDPGEPLPPGCIYNSNRHGMIALAHALRCTVTDLGNLPDDAEAIRVALKDAAASHDLILTSGGVSVGGEDHVTPAIEAIGTLHFWKLLLRPGKPAVLGEIGNAAFLGLPGNPVSALLGFLLLARPLILKLAGCDDAETVPTAYRVAAGFALRKRHDRREFLRARLESGGDGAPRAVLYPSQGSGVLSSLVWSDGLVDVPAGPQDIAEGDPVDYLPLREVLS